MTACCISRRFRLNSYQPLKLIPEKLDLFSAQQKIFFVSNMTSPSSSDDATNEWTSVDPSELSGGARYGLCISSVVPRPVAVISSISESGVVNCAPFSYSGICGHGKSCVSHQLFAVENQCIPTNSSLTIEIPPRPAYRIPWTLPEGWPKEGYARQH